MISYIFSWPGRSSGRDIVLPPVGVGIGGGVGVSKKFNVKVFYVMGKALSGELSCPCDRSCEGDYLFTWSNELSYISNTVG